MTYTKRQLYCITHRLYKDLKKNPALITMKKLRSCHGEYDYGTDEIRLDYRMKLVPTLVHEHLHKWYPNKSETWILNRECVIMNNLSVRQIKNILFAFISAIK